MTVWKITVQTWKVARQAELAGTGSTGEGALWRARFQRLTRDDLDKLHPGRAAAA